MPNECNNCDCIDKSQCVKKDPNMLDPIYNCDRR